MSDASASTATAVPVAQGVRAPWTAIPAHLRARIAEIVGGGAVVEAVTQAGGFSPGPAVRVRTAEGRRAFVKAVSVEMNPDTPAMHRHEAEYTARMPAHAPVPKLLGTLDEDGWVVLVFEEIDGRNPGPAWDPDDLRRVVAAIAELSAALTPPPIEAPPVAERLAGFHGWADLRAARQDGLRSELQSELQAAQQAGTDRGTGGVDLGVLDAWALDRIDTLIGLEAQALVLCTGNTLLNLDVRSDNILMSADSVYFVDWPWAAVGAAWLDLALFVPSVWMQGGPDLARIVTEHPLLTGADPEALTAFVACFTGMLLHRSTQPAPQGLPTLRPFQRAYGGAAMEWLRTLLP
ncbi:MAG: phosphotransferase [Catenulispora sp.]|nr:phosphotransferase [Catenulispora sp.]